MSPASKGSLYLFLLWSKAFFGARVGPYFWHADSTTDFGWLMTGAPPAELNEEEGSNGAFDLCCCCCDVLEKLENMLLPSTLEEANSSLSSRLAFLRNWAVIDSLLCSFYDWMSNEVTLLWMRGLMSFWQDSYLENFSGDSLRVD